MDNIVILNKIETLRNCVSRIELKCPGKIEELKNNYDLQDIISLNLERAIQSSVDIALHIIADTEEKVPTTMGESFIILQKLKFIPKDLAMNLQKSIGFRNISVHEYKKIDWEIVYEIITNHLSNFKEYVKYILKLLDNLK